ncbi:MAG: DUF3108 domain-containing protein [Luteimonas sp.]
MNTPIPHCRLLSLLLAWAWLPATGLAQDAPGSAAAPVDIAAPADITADAAATAIAAPALEPFVATYEAYNAGKPAGAATLQLVHNAGAQWRVDLGIRANRGVVGVLGLDIQQSTVFESNDGQFKPLSQSTVRKGFLLGKKITGVYDWSAGVARWTGDIKQARSQPIALEPGDLDGLLIDLAIIRDAVPGKRLDYRFVDGGRVRQHLYEVSMQTENVAVGDLNYRTMRVSRTNGGNDETIFWVANGVPTPVRILQRTDGQDAIDLRLTQYQGVN